MNERGFFTIVGLCLLLAVAISIRGVQEFEGNYSVGAINSLAEFELQNAADTALVEMIKTGKYNNSIASERFGTIKVQVSSVTNKNIRRFRREYKPGDTIKDTPLNEDNSTDAGSDENISDETPEWLKLKATSWTSVASCENPIFGGKIYRKSMAYVLKDGTVYFLTNL